MKELNTYDDNLEGGQLPDLLGVNPFTVPSNYFEETAAHLRRLCKLPANENDAQLTDPANAPTYFQDLADQIKLRISLEEVLSTDKDAGFEVPAHYFEEAPQEILSAVKLETLFESADSDGLIVDKDYFKTLNYNIMQRVAAESNRLENTSTKATKIFPIRRWMKYTAAACLLFVLSIAAFMTLNKEENVSPVAQKALAEPSFEAISDDELIGYLALNNDHDHLDYFVEYIYDNDENAEEKACSKYNDQELEAYINQML